ncbi:MAG: phage major capsid protein, partial [Gammaproteobacteria bacterium]|nr:phage major capsid protein [Gammaproteobacteria bacterium]
MAWPTLSETLDNLYTTTWQHMKSQVRDNIFNAIPFWFWLKNKGKLKPIQGGRWISEPVVYDKNDNVTWLTKGGTTPLNDYEFMTIAKYDWRYVAIPIVRFGIDDQQNRGKAQIINFMNAKLENTKNSLISDMETTLFQAKTSGDKEPFGLQDLVQDTPTSNPSGGAVGEIPSTSTWWRNQYTSMTGKSCSVYLVSYMRTMLNKCMKNLTMDAPDIIVTGQHPYELYEDETMEQKQIVNKTLGDAGFQ